MKIKSYGNNRYKNIFTLKINAFFCRLNHVSRYAMGALKFSSYYNKNIGRLIK